MNRLLLMTLVAIAGCSKGDYDTVSTGTTQPASSQYTFGWARYHSTGVAVGDFDGDYRDDVVYIDANNKVHIVLNTGQWK
jgi:hypothetical protein